MTGEADARDIRRVEQRVEQLYAGFGEQNSQMSAMTQQLNRLERDVNTLSTVRDGQIRLQAQWENFLASDLPDLNARLDKIASNQTADKEARTQEREDARKDRRNTLIALLSIAAILLGALIPVLLSLH